MTFKLTTQDYTFILVPKTLRKNNNGFLIIPQKTKLSVNLST